MAPRLRNDLYCVEWDVKLYYTIPLDPLIPNCTFNCSRNSTFLRSANFVKKTLAMKKLSQQRSFGQKLTRKYKLASINSPNKVCPDFTNLTTAFTSYAGAAPGPRLRIPVPRPLCKRSKVRKKQPPLLTSRNGWIQNVYGV